MMPVAAQGTAAEASAAAEVGDDGQGLVTEPLRRAASMRDELSRHILETADRIDLFFGDERMSADHNGSYLQLDTFARYLDEQKPAYGVLIRSKIDLPRTEDRLKLVLESEDSGTGTADASDGSRAGDPIEAAGDTRFALALRYMARQTQHLNINLDTGIRLSSGGYFFTRIRARRSEEWGHWAARFAQTFTWRNDDGWLSASRLDFDRPLGDPLLFRASTSATWTEIEEQFSLAQDLTLFQTLDDRSSLSYRIGVQGVSEPVVHNTNYVADLRYRHRLNRNWLYYEILPAVNWSREQDFAAIHSIVFTLSVVFGAS